MLENKGRLAERTPLRGLQLHRPSLSLSKKQRKGNVPEPEVFCAYLICVLFGDPLTAITKCAF